MSDKKEFPPRWLTFVCLLSLLVGVSLLVFDKWSAMQDTQTAQTSAETLALDIGRICAEHGSLMVDERDVCDKGEAVLQDPTQPISGPKGEPGKDGINGIDGEDGQPGKDGADGKDGPQGLPGKDGADGTDGVNGTNGLNGADGKDGLNGANGADSTVPGPGGPAGPQGEPGRGIADTHCQDNGLWQITYTDGAVDTDAGQCYEPKGPIETPIGGTP